MANNNKTKWVAHVINLHPELHTEFHETWKMLRARAIELSVPMSVLLLRILQDWVKRGRPDHTT